jgi:regulatory protein
VADAALAELPDDDADRALDFARTKARSMSSLDRDTALRRLVGQLSRRGYGGSVAMTAARQALDENGSGGSGVRFR